MTNYRENMSETLEYMAMIRERKILERELSDTELKRREEIAKELPDSDFKDRYGEKWMEVKMATATKMAKKESVEQEKSDLTEAGGLSPAMVNKLRKAYSTLNKIDPTSPAGKKMTQMMDKMNKEQLQALVKADIKFISLLAVNRLIRMGMNAAQIRKLKEGQEEFTAMLDRWESEEVELDESEFSAMAYGKKDQRFVVKPRDTSGMAGKQDKFKMYVVQLDNKGREKKVIKDLGSHVSVDSAIKFAKNKKIIEEVEVDEKKKQPVFKGTPEQIKKQMKDWKKKHDKVKIGEGYQVYVKSPTAKSGWIPQGQPHKTEADAMKDAKNFRGATRVVKEEVELDEKKDSYELYHKDFSSAMQHAYAHAKRMYGISIKPSEIDDKVATGPSKPGSGKTNKYRLKGDKGAIQVQVYNKGGSKPYELNMYKEEVELNEKPYSVTNPDLGVWRGDARSDADAAEKAMRKWGIRKSAASSRMFMKKTKVKKEHDFLDHLEVDEAVLKGRDYEYDEKEGVVKISKKNFAKVHKDSKGTDKSKPTMMVLTKKGTSLVPVKFTEAWEIGTDEYRKYLEDLTPMEGARRDAYRDMKKAGELDSKDDDDEPHATKDDRKAANKNILQQLKKTIDTKGKANIEFLDKKKNKVPYKVAVEVIRKYMSMRRSGDKLKFQQKVAKSYRDMLAALKENYELPKTHKETILDRIDTKIKERKNG